MSFIRMQHHHHHLTMIISTISPIPILPLPTSQTTPIHTTMTVCCYLFQESYCYCAEDFKLPKAVHTETSSDRGG
ncbi:hypothetical protein EON63_23800 [archaeon]|nr:MAG: hypothetical protein EON63_23800 [archaeon]